MQSPRSKSGDMSWTRVDEILNNGEFMRGLREVKSTVKDGERRQEQVLYRVTRMQSVVEDWDRRIDDVLSTFHTLSRVFFWVIVLVFIFFFVVWVGELAQFCSSDTSCQAVVYDRVNPEP